MKSNYGLKSQERDEIRKIIEEHEKTRWGEIVPVVVGRSTPDGLYPFAWGLSVFFLFEIAFAYWVERESDFPLSIHSVFMWMSGVTFFVSMLYLSSFIQRILIGKKRLHDFVKSRAYVEFLSEGLHQTSSRMGVLILISVFERRIEILADRGLNDKVTSDQWKKISNHAAKNISEKNLFKAIKEAVEQTSHLLSLCGEKSELKSTSINELSDDLRVKK